MTNILVVWFGATLMRHQTHDVVVEIHRTKSGSEILQIASCNAGGCLHDGFNSTIVDATSSAGVT